VGGGWYKGKEGSRYEREGYRERGGYREKGREAREYNIVVIESTYFTSSMQGENIDVTDDKYDIDVGIAKNIVEVSGGASSTLLISYVDL
jgi:hypothetical protein